MGSSKSSGSSSRRRQDWLVLNPSRRNRKIRLHGTVALAVVRMQQDALRRQRPPSPPLADTDSQLASLVRYKNEAALSKLGGLHGVIQELHTDHSNGIADDPHQVQSRKQRYGENTYPKPPPKSFLSFLWEAFHDKTLIILMVCAALSLAFGMKTEGPKEGWYDGASIGFAVLLVVFVTATSDYRQSLQFRSLNEEKENIQMQVVRGGRRFATSIFHIVVGDIVPLNIGDQIPADGLLVAGHSLKVDESSMTGESKLATIDLSNPFLVSGCKIADGYGTMVVTAVGTNTEWGNLMAAVSEEGEEETPLQVRLTGVASFIGKIGIAVAAIVFAILIAYYFTGRIVASDKENAQKFQAGKTGGEEILDRLVNIFAIAVTIIVVAVPEGLPLAVTLTLAYSMRKMMADKALVRQLSACETMGSATAICSDKTGTLTLNQMNVVKAWVAGRMTEDCAKVREEVGSEAVYQVLLEGIAQNSSGSVFADRTKPGSPPEVSGSPTEKAVLLWGVSMGMDFEAVRARSAIMQVEAFSSEKKRAGVAVTGVSDGGGRSIMRVHWKGAAEIVLSLCDSWADGEHTRVLTEEKQAEVKSVIEGMAAGSLRCVAFAYRELAQAEVPPESEWESWAIPAEPGLVLLAVVGIKDPCRPGVRDSVRLCQEAGVKVRMVTGDNLVTAKAIATECGILRDGADDLAIEGQAFRVLSDAKRLQLVPKLAVMARSSPNDKLLLVRALKSLGEVVAVTGDGTNDAPALHDADIGLSMGIAGTEVAKETSDIIILDDNFATVVKVVRWGRSVYFNVQKFIQFQLTVNVAALAINFVAAVAGGEVPLTAVQLLWVNLIMDTLGALAIATEPPSDHLMARPPAGRSSPIVTNVMWRNLLAQAAYQVGVLLTLHFRGKAILGLRGPRASAVNNTVIFNAFVLCQLFNEVNCRQPERLNIFANVARSPLFGAIVGVTLALQFVIVEFLGRFASTERLTWQQWLICAGISFVSWPLAFAVKLIPVPDKPCINTAGLSCFGLKKKEKQHPRGEKLESGARAPEAAGTTESP